MKNIKIILSCAAMALFTGQTCNSMTRAFKLLKNTKKALVTIPYKNFRITFPADMRPSLKVIMETLTQEPGSQEWYLELIQKLDSADGPPLEMPITTQISPLITNDQEDDKENNEIIALELTDDDLDAATYVEDEFEKTGSYPG